ncbi:hypothetical protein [Dendronalium sp. ChiSLP03b]|uniref:hypothetical protein n=1 Tax=Dendronalium sp. ChiSLP03b TaxID=3075381 RepID=UPI002AD41E55|nr:hypothetical protein [Dendronalium sp. ChiSLP03b]MDZ8207527.1 hypothetical protein [Dendronalium sp. ChiSLP03b]
MLPTAEEKERQKADEAQQQAQQAQQRAERAESQLQQTAKNLLQSGMTVEQVANITGLSNSEIAALDI